MPPEGGSYACNVYPAYDGEMEKHMEVPEEIRLALTLARQTARGSGKIATFAKEMERILERGISQIEVAELPNVARRADRSGEEQVIYVVDQDRGHGEALAEHRTSGKSKPMRCPKRVYDALAGVLGAADRPLGLDEVMTAVEKVMGDRPADHQVRVALRLWMHVDPPLVSRNRARYRLIDTNSFTTRAKALWDILKPSSH